MQNRLLIDFRMILPKCAFISNLPYVISVIVDSYNTILEQIIFLCGLGGSQENLGSSHFVRYCSLINFGMLLRRYSLFLLESKVFNGDLKSFGVVMANKMRFYLTPCLLG